MKKSLVALSLSMLLAIVVGCGAKPAASSAAPQASDAAPVADKKIVRVGTSASYYPWAHQENDKLKGFEVEVWEEIAKRNNYELEFKLSAFSGLVGMLDNNEIDTVAHQMSITPARLEKYVFSEPYAYSFYDFFVKNDSPIATLDDLKGKKVGCWLGGNGEATLRKANEDHKLNLEIVTFDGAPMEKEVELGRIDALWQGEIKTLTTIKNNNLPLKGLNQKLTFEVNAYPFAKTQQGETLAKEVTDALKAMREDGTLATISEKWFALDTTKAPAGK